MKKNRLFQLTLDKRALVILGILLIFAGIFTKEFLTFSNLKNVMLQVATDGIVAVGATFVIISGGIDLSVGSVIALVSVVTIRLQARFNTPLGIVVSIVIAIIIGLSNGLLITRIGISPFITTLGMMTLVKGISLAISDSRSHTGVDPNFARLADFPIFGIPFAAIAFVFFTLLANTFLVKTPTGRGYYAVGGNPEASWLSGLDTNRYILMAYVFSSFCTAIGGILLTSRINTGSPIIANDTGTTVISAVLLGGASMAGGIGTVYGTFIGVLILGVLKNMMNLIGIGGYYQTIILGLLLVITVLMDRKHLDWNRKI